MKTIRVLGVWEMTLFFSVLPVLMREPEKTAATR